MGEAVAEQEGVSGSSLIGSSTTKASAGIETLASPGASDSIETLGTSADDMDAQVTAASHRQKVLTPVMLYEDVVRKNVDKQSRQ